MAFSLQGFIDNSIPTIKAAWLNAVDTMYALGRRTNAGTPITLANSQWQVTDSANNYSSMDINNQSAGTSASSDFVATANTGTDTTQFVNMGINGSAYSVAGWTVNGALDAYVYASDGNMAIGTAAAKRLDFFVGETLAANVAMTISSAGVASLAASPITSDNSTKIATTAYVKGQTSTAIPPRSYLAGLTLSAAGGGVTLGIAAGMATDSTNATSLTIAAFTKTTASFVAGSGGGMLDTGTTGGAASTWYSVYIISTAAGALTDILMSLSATSPTMPATYTLFRRIGSIKLDGSKNITGFIQDGDYFRWLASVLDVNATAKTTTAQTITLTVPTGVNVFALFDSRATVSGTGGLSYYSDLAATDEAASQTAAPLMSSGLNSAGVFFATNFTRTNTSAQVRGRWDENGGAYSIATLGWTDYRGRNA